ncbi:hypothetical protein HDU97_006480 [Phlyctochytrium planicorne]|nr:hypothetical protein HDU97_006480 [Phlyctochytrium planicorne]
MTTPGMQTEAHLSLPSHPSITGPTEFTARVNALAIDTGARQDAVSETQLPYGGSRNPVKSRNPVRELKGLGRGWRKLIKILKQLCRARDLLTLTRIWGPLGVAIGVEAAIKNTRDASYNCANYGALHESSMYERFKRAIPRLIQLSRHDGIFVEMATERALQEEWTEEELQSSLNALGANHSWEASEEERTIEMERVQIGDFDR